MAQLKDYQKIILSEISKMAKDKILPMAGTMDKEGKFNLDSAKLLGEMGLLQIFLPPEYGGLEEDQCLMFCLCIEEVAKACASSALTIIIQAVGSFPIIEAGSSEQKDTYFPRLASGKELVAYLVTEPHAGSDVAAIKTKSVRKGDNYLLSGRKCFATNGGVASISTVLCLTGEKELSFFVLDMNANGVFLGKEEDKLGFRASNTQEVILEDVLISEKNLLGKKGEGFVIAMKDFDMSRPGVAALSLGIAESSVEAAIEYACQRHTFGKPLIRHQAIEFMIADALTHIEAGRGLMIEAARTWDKKLKNTKLASMAKYFCSDAAMRITTDAVQILGGYGYCKDFHVERMFRDAKLTQIFEGANQIQRMVVGREALKERGFLL
ncbi:MAG: acyl-CoA dehydrogenase [Desulfobacteraceae bacterium]|jgi:cyclohexane-1-carbonyl-CoA dehydrogenase|nr:MAG: acyl-CoA dehydrogenase [Desulfobacteraceae bacterium]